MADGATTLNGGAFGDGTGEVECPHCGSLNPRIAGALSGAPAIVDCRQCDRSFAQMTDTDAAGVPVARPARAAAGFNPDHARSPTDVGMRLTGAVGAVVTLVFYLAVVRPLDGTYFADLFANRGWVPYGIAWLSAWAGVLLLIKTWLLASQRRALDLDLLPDAISPRITPDNADDFRAHARELAGERLTPPPLTSLLGAGASRSLLVERIQNALVRFRMRGSASDAADQLTSHAQLDANSVESSYTMVRVFIWAIPLLGFIGTVIGISAAVAGFSDSVASAVDLDVMKQSIGSVTTGLGVAFDTTLLALVMSIAIMFPASSLQKAEEDFLSRVEAYCDERLARRLDDGNPPASASAGDGLEELQRQISRLAQTIETLDGKLTRGG